MAEEEKDIWSKIIWEKLGNLTDQLNELSARLNDLSTEVAKNSATIHTILVLFKYVILPLIGVIAALTGVEVAFPKE